LYDGLGGVALLAGHRMDDLLLRTFMYGQQSHEVIEGVPLSLAGCVGDLRK
jgi:hypothetical protein